MKKDTILDLITILGCYGGLAAWLSKGTKRMRTISNGRRWLTQD